MGTNSSAIALTDPRTDPSCADGLQRGPVSMTSMRTMTQRMAMANSSATLTLESSNSSTLKNSSVASGSMMTTGTNGGGLKFHVELSGRTCSTEEEILSVSMLQQVKRAIDESLLSNMHGNYGFFVAIVVAAKHATSISPVSRVPAALLVGTTRLFLEHAVQSIDGRLFAGLAQPGLSDGRVGHDEPPRPIPSGLQHVLPGAVWAGWSSGDDAACVHAGQCETLGPRRQDGRRQGVGSLFIGASKRRWGHLWRLSV